MAEEKNIFAEKLFALSCSVACTREYVWMRVTLPCSSTAGYVALGKNTYQRYQVTGGEQGHVAKQKSVAEKKNVLVSYSSISSNYIATNYFIL